MQLAGLHRCRIWRSACASTWRATTRIHAPWSGQSPSRKSSKRSVGVERSYPKQLNHYFVKDTTLGAMKPIVEVLVRDGVPMSSFDLTGAILNEANLRKADFTTTMLKHALLLRTDLSDAVLDRANICNSDLRGANLSNATLFRTGLSYALLTRANLSSANLNAAYLNETNLQHADFNAAKLIGADFRKARLMEALLTDADLTDANLTGADLRKADLSGAVMNNADLTNADFRGAIGLTQSQLQTTCAAPTDPPQLPQLLTWKESRCPPKEVIAVTRDCFYHVDSDTAQ